MDENPYESPQPSHPKPRRIVGLLLAIVILPVAVFGAFFATCAGVYLGTETAFPDHGLFSLIVGMIAGAVAAGGLIRWWGNRARRRIP